MLLCVLILTTTSCLTGMAKNKKITDLPLSIPKRGYSFVAASGLENFQIDYSGLAEYSSIGTKTGSFKDSLTISGYPVLTGISGDPLFEGLKNQVENNVPSSFAFFSDVVNNTGGTLKQYNPTPFPNIYLSEVAVDTASDMKVSIRWDGPPDDYIGTGYIEGMQIPIENITELGDKTRRFEGYLDNLDLRGKTKVSGFANGTSAYFNLVELGQGILSADISIHETNTATAAPGSLLGTSDLKNGDTINIDIVYDTNNFTHPLQIPASINVFDEDLAQQSTHENLTWWDSPLSANYSGVTVPITVSNRNGNLGVCISSTNQAGITSSKQCSSTFADNNRSRTVDNISPSIIFGSIDYPLNQGAIKGSETAVVNHTITNADSYAYSSDNTELNIATPNIYEPAKLVSRINGDYNVSVDNFNIQATKSTNGIIVSNSTNVKIANTPIALSIQNLSTNIQSGPNSGVAHNFSLKSTQIYNSVPTLNLDSSQNPISSLSHTSQSTQPNSNSLQLVVKDSEQKGAFNWVASAINLAGIPTTTVIPASYTIAGFNQRDILAYPNSLGDGLASIGSTVTNPSNITFENVSKGGPGPNGGTLFSYKTYADGIQLDNTYDFVDKFTVCDSNGVTKSSGDHVFNLDKLNRAANTSTSNPAKFIIKEN